MKVKAKQRGYINGVLYDIGNVFEITGAGELGSWMDVIEEPKPKAKAKAKKSKADEVKAEEE